MLSNIEKYYNKHKEDLRLLRRHGIVEFRVSMKFILKYLPKDRPPQEVRILDLGAGTGRYSIELHNLGYDVTVVELVKHNIDMLRKHNTTIPAYQSNAMDLSRFADNEFDAVISFGPLYHLISDNDKLKALSETKRVVKSDGIVFQAYVMNDYSILTYCFEENRMADLMRAGVIDEDFNIHPKADELYDYATLDSIDRLNKLAGFERLTIFSPDGPSDFMRPRINAMSEENFELFVQYQMRRAERKDLLGAGSHLVDVLRPVF